MLTRCLSGIAVTTLPVAPTSSLVKTFGKMRQICSCAAAHRVRHYRSAAGVWGWLAVVLVWLGLFVFWGCSHMAKKQFGGITGDLAGFSWC
ncbi:MAG: adenosylcobinamide-GDP ribazoletransferase [Ruminococcus sp.]